MGNPATDKRPGAAAGHVFMAVPNVARAQRFFAALGLRRIVNEPGFAVMELRGGTHLVLQRARRPSRRGRAAPFDLMFDDLDAVHRACTRRILRPSPLRRGRIHDTFTLLAPGGHRLSMFSSHASRHPV